MFSTPVIDDLIDTVFMDSRYVMLAKSAREEKELLIVKLEEYKTLLKEIEWVKDEGNGCYYCPTCERDKEITFGSTATDSLCPECAKELKLCKRCNGKID